MKKNRVLFLFAFMLGVVSMGSVGFSPGDFFDNNFESQDDAPADGNTPSDGNSLEDLAGVSNYIKDLIPYESWGKGDRTPFDIWRYAGKNGSSFGSPKLPGTFEEWKKMNMDRKDGFMKDIDEYMASRFNFSGKTIEGVKMSGGRKAVMDGPIAIVPKGKAFKDLSKMAAEEIRKQDLFPYKPLAHPIHTTAHMVFPDNWNVVHPDHIRMDMDHDFPDVYLPEFPPPMFLTTHKELGDVTRGQEITFLNYYDVFNGLLTAEQMEGLKELLRPTPTTWFNQTSHRITEEPMEGIACFSCHVNGHTNGAFELGPDARPNEARLRVETPTMRGNFNLMQLSSKRSVRSMDHFAEIEEYFDGDPGMMQAIGPRAHQKTVSNRMGDFNAILDFPPAPKLGPDGKLFKSKATQQELRGESLFHGKAKCVSCHSGPAFVDDYMHDLQVERFYVGRPEGPIKTFPLRGIKDSPPYLHDGRCPTLHDAVEFFNIVLELRLEEQEKEDLVAYLLCL
jgi:cytochrome c peroxidase